MHQKLVDEILIALGGRPNIRIWKRVVGLFRYAHHDGLVSIGIPGEPDLQGIIAPHGRMLAIEVKTGTGKLSNVQKNYRDMFVKFGGLYIEARNLNQTIADLEKQI